MKSLWHWVQHRLGMNLGTVEIRNGVVGFQCSKCGSFEPRKIRFASRSKALKAGERTMKQYAEMFRKLAE